MHTIYVKSQIIHTRELSCMFQPQIAILRDSSQKLVGDFTYMDGLWFYINCVHLLVCVWVIIVKM